MTTPSPSGKVNALIGSFSKGNAPPIKTGPMPPGRKLTKEIPVVEEDPNLTEEEKMLKKKGFNTDSLNAGSLHRRRKANSKLALDKVNKNFAAGTTDSIEIDAKGQSIGGQSTFGKNTIKKLGFQMAKSSHINFYDQWKTDDYYYPDSVVRIFETFMKSVGVGGVPKPDEEDWVGDFMEKLHTKLSVQSQNNFGVIPKNYRKLMPSMFEDSQALLERQKKLERIVKIQSVYRGYFARKELREWLAEPDVKFTKSKRHQCNLAFRDLLKAETDYNNDLKSAVEHFLWPLRQMSTEAAKRNSTIDLSFWTSGTPPVILPKEDIDAIFSNMEILLATHQRILKKLHNLRETWPFFDNVGEVFLKLAPQLIPYGDYVANSKHALDTLVRLQSSDPKFNAFLTAMSQNEKDLMGYLVRPLNHITQYALYLKVVKKNTPAEDPGMEHLRNAYLAIKKTKQFIQEYYETAGNRAKIAEIQRHLISPRNTPYELSRKTFLQQGHVTISEKGLVMTSDKKKSFYLLNDLLLLCDENGKKVTHEFPLKEIQFENDIVICNGQKTVFAEKSEIVKKIKEINDTLTNSHKVFGLPLQKLLEREKPVDGIPYIIKCCVEYLKKKREMEGIFRISGGTAEVAALKDMFNKAEGNPINLNGQNPYAVAAILKMWFRELPEPIFTFNAFKPLASLNMEDEQVSIKQIKQIVETLPSVNQNLIKYLFSFVLSVAKLGTINKMTASNLAIVFGPNLLYPQEETLETIMLIPKMNALFLFMFEHYTEIFGEKIDMK